MTQVIPDLIQWHEGLLLSPQHFQQLSLRLESLIQAVPGRYFPHFWASAPTNTTRRNSPPA
jgi:predicted component of type VI protein secretion system